jgi:hypothetical protein
MGQTRHWHPARRLPKRRVELAFLSLGCSPSATWRVGSYTFSIIVLKTFFFFSIINVWSIDGKNIIICFVNFFLYYSS